MNENVTEKLRNLRPGDEPVHFKGETPRLLSIKSIAKRLNRMKSERGIILRTRLIRSWKTIKIHAEKYPRP